MLSRSSFNLINLDDYSCVVDHRPRIPRIMTVPGIFSGTGEGEKVTGERRIIVAPPTFQY